MEPETCGPWVLVLLVMALETTAVVMVNGDRYKSCSSFQGVMEAKLAVGLLQALWGLPSAQAESVDIWQYLFNHGFCVCRIPPFDRRHADAEFCLPLL